MNRIFPAVRTLVQAAMIALLPALALTASAQRSGLQAFNDTIDLYPNIPVVHDILTNDSIPAGDTVKTVTVYGVYGQPGVTVDVLRVHDTTWKWTFTFTLKTRGYAGEAGCKYFVRTAPFDTATGKIIYRIHDRSFAYLDINNVRARLHSDGNHFFYENAEFEVPKGSGKTSIFSNSLWIGGLDASKKLHLAGYRYGQGPTNSSAHSKNDYFSGPLMDKPNYSVYRDTTWYRIWNLKKSDIEYHRQHYWQPGYTPIEDILQWPGNGDTTLGQAWHLAPFSDRNGNGKYEPFDGDYPEIRGDQALFFIFNDDANYHSETQGDPLRIEVHGLAYAFDMPGDSALDHAVFLNYKFFNRSQNTYDSTFLGVFTDIDLGYANDDYQQCDVGRGMLIGYNGTPVDGTGQPYAYGANPPAQGVAILAGPTMDPDGIDNPRTGPGGYQLCDFSINGLNFGDTVVDNERLGMTRFMYFNNSNAGVPDYMTDPRYAPDYYSFLRGIWKDGTPMIYGGNAHPSTGGYGPACWFMFPGLSDPLNWGVGCAPPNGPVNWTEVTTGNNPQDRRGLQSCGPFTFHPGDVQEIDIAFIWARDYTSGEPLGSVAKLQTWSDTIRHAFRANRLPDGNPFYGMNDGSASSAAALKIRPNPARDQVTVTLEGFGKGGGITIELQTLQGKPLRYLTPSGNPGSVTFSVAGLPGGIYLVRACDSRQVAVAKLLVVR